MKKNHFLQFMYLLVGIYLTIAALLFVFQRAFIYFPTDQYAHNFEKIMLQNDDENIEIIVLNRGNEDAFIYFGGNAEAVVANANEFSNHFLNKTMYLVNYRGYGGSSGKPTQSGLFSDAAAIFDRLAPAHRNLAVVGRSLGSSVAMHLAANRPVSQFVLITPYDSMLALAKKQYPMFPISLLLKDKYDSMSLAHKVSAPVLVLAGGKDKLIPLIHSKNVVEALGPENANMIVIEQAGHNNIFQFEDSYASLTRFFEGRAK
jgi:hypothetical protein